MSFRTTSSSRSNVRFYTENRRERRLTFFEVDGVGGERGRVGSGEKRRRKSHRVWLGKEWEEEVIIGTSETGGGGGGGNALSTLYHTIPRP